MAVSIVRSQSFDFQIDIYNLLIIHPIFYQVRDKLHGLNGI